jgi:hypothetical protein
MRKLIILITIAIFSIQTALIYRSSFASTFKYASFSLLILAGFTLILLNIAEKFQSNPSFQLRILLGGSVIKFLFTLGYFLALGLMKVENIRFLAVVVFVHFIIYQILFVRSVLKMK